MVKDLTDPVEPGKEKTMYCDRFLIIEAQRCISHHFDRPSAGARSLQWSDEEEPDDGLTVGDLDTGHKAWPYALCHAKIERA